MTHQVGQIKYRAPYRSCSLYVQWPIFALHSNVETLCLQIWELFNFIEHGIEKVKYVKLTVNSGLIEEHLMSVPDGTAHFQSECQTIARLLKNLMHSVVTGM